SFGRPRGSASTVLRSCAKRASPMARPEPHSGWAATPPLPKHLGPNPAPRRSVAHPRERNNVSTEWKVGQELPAQHIEITPSLIVAGALASRDFNRMHHDSAMAEKAGSADIFMNILTTNGLVSAFITKWAGSQVRIQSIKIKLGAPNMSGDTLVFNG